MTILPINHLADLPTPVLRVSDLRQWAYCPRIAWWTLVCPVPKVESFKMQTGRLKEHRLQQLQSRRTLRRFGLRQGTVESNIDLFSPRLGLVGRLDLMVRTGACRYPVEVKFTQGPTRLNHCLQLAGYALLLEDLFGVPVSHGYLARLPDDVIDRIDLDDPLRALAVGTLHALRGMIRDERIPPPSPILARCIDCEYRLFCGDVLS